MTKQDFIITRISNGLQFGHGSISGQDEVDDVLGQVDATIRNSANILVSVGRYDNGRFIQDDGCGDGREVVKIFAGDRKYKRSLNRSKVFGGSAAMTTAALIGTGRGRHKSLNEVFDMAIQALDSRGIEFGAHTDQHASGENCGCGAIDKAPEAILAALKYEPAIRDVLKALNTDTSQLNVVYSHFRSYVREIPEQTPYSGRQVMDQIISTGKVVKQLGGEHRERRIILNTVREYTENQALIREKTGDRAQAFAVDIWRLSDIAARLFPDEPVRRDQAYLGELIYTLAIAAVLTKGDLPVDMIQEAPQAVAA